MFTSQGALCDGDVTADAESLVSVGHQHLVAMVMSMNTVLRKCSERRKSISAGREEPPKPRATRRMRRRWAESPFTLKCFLFVDSWTVRMGSDSEGENLIIDPG